MKSAEKRLKDAQTKYAKTKEAAAKALKGVKEAKARLAAAHELWESRYGTVSCLKVSMTLGQERFALHSEIERV